MNALKLQLRLICSSLLQWFVPAAGITLSSPRSVSYTRKVYLYEARLVQLLNHAASSGPNGGQFVLSSLPQCFVL